MSESEGLAEQVFKMVQAVRSGEIDPLEIRLTNAYKDLQELAAKIDSRIDIDEMLNEVLSTKVARVQELARVLAAPEIYVNRLKGKSTRELAKLLTPCQPLTINQLEHKALGQSLERIVHLIDALSREPTEDPVPKVTELPNGYALDTEDSVFLEDLERFLQKFGNGRVIFDEIVESDEFDVFLKQFLYVVILVSRGQLNYDPETREVWRPSIAEIDST
ncbi:MAG: hypothetical protein ACW99X_07725 [Candidatus Thorarchaeota archaeon]|jgi:hypothetical protein